MRFWCRGGEGCRSRRGEKYFTLSNTAEKKHRKPGDIRELAMPFLIFLFGFLFLVGFFICLFRLFLQFGAHAL